MKKELKESYIIDAIRTPLGRRNGFLKDLHAVDLLAIPLKTVVERNYIKLDQIDDIIAGCVTQIGEQGANVARNAALSVGFPETVPGTTVDRQCGSSLQALQFADQGINSGFYNIVLAAGVESMSRHTIGSNISKEKNPITASLEERYSLKGNWFSQAYGAELIAKDRKLTRSELDEFSLRSHKAALRAREHFKKEIIPVDIEISKDGETIAKKIDYDEGVRENTSMEKLAGLPPAFNGLELITAGNSSQISDGASAVLLASEEAVEKNNLKPRARILSASVVGVDPVTMLTGPIPATRKALERAGLDISQIDLFEVNEAFAPVPLAWLDEFDIDERKLNPNGGAIALGHPLGATGCRIVTTMINELKATGKKLGLIAICEGGGMSNSAIIELL
ncbi:MAG: thiolase family protein [Candidatus Thermoplasmatota archaeon]|nr:thiolase family protein [Candidatus Thermoplasmatota archaeon]